MTTMRPQACLWCSGPLPEGVTRGSPRRFYQPAHRRAYQTAARQYVDGLVRAGQIGPGDLAAQNTPRKARSLVSGGVPQIRVVWAAPAGRLPADAGALAGPRRRILNAKSPPVAPQHAASREGQCV